ncbi:glucuronate isomerase [Ornithinimicrobium pekingense]|uniref:Uronate isomerase n=1 Tax=Ornithinimicrobium pekingense TaxID=384677 RepID=A0ABQ2F4V0_9MICO|nr:glucuronate isomerase [Ornithinimicrobium pekingense]GGK62118.1 uronate isomerase [Ornithinimicrobium pekingense]
MNPTTTASRLTLHPDRLLPVDPGTRDVARRIYAEVAGLPIVSPHGHVPPAWLAQDTPFADPTSMLITPDHYITRVLHASGVQLSSLGVGRGELSPQESREAFRIFCRHWPVYRGTPMRLWFETQLVEVFGIDLVPSAGTADAIYDAIAAWIARDSSRPRALMDSFEIEFLATTDDPCDDLAHHRALADDPSFARKVVPTFRPDRYLEPATAAWVGHVDRLAQVSGQDTGTYAGWVAAMEDRRAYFKAHGAVSTDHSHRDLGTEPLEGPEAERLYALARRGEISAPDGDRLRRHMVTEMVRMATEDGLTMTLHPAVHRNHHTPTFDTYGADVGADIPIAVEVTRALQPALARFGTHPDLTLVVFTIDETVYSRELAPLAGFYPSLRIGVPWWFIDAPDAITRFRAAVTESAGFTRTSGFIDDTRAFLSIPARHDMARRLDSGFLARLVAEHRLSEDEAVETARYLVRDQPREVFGL